MQRDGDEQENIFANLEKHARHLEKTLQIHSQTKKHAAKSENTTKYRNVLQRKKAQPNTEMYCKERKHSQIQKCTANAESL